MPTVLLIDDDADTLEMYAMGLQYAGFSVRTSLGAERLLEELVANPPDCIVADLRMPGVTGMELCRTLASDPRLAHVPRLALSGSAFAHDIAAALAAGFDEVLVKPYLPDDLAHSISRAVVRRQVTRRPVP